jgi:hypothetical protein
VLETQIARNCQAFLCRVLFHPVSVIQSLYASKSVLVLQAADGLQHGRGVCRQSLGSVEDCSRLSEVVWMQSG